MAPQQALALRRLLLTMAAMTGTLVAHAICSGGLAIAPAAPLVWGSVCCLAVIAGGRPGERRRAMWRAWSPAGLLARLVAVEMALHLALTGAPWAFGVTVHHSPDLVAPASLAAHGAAALVLGLALLAAQHVLSAAQHLIDALRRALRVAGATGPPRCVAPRHSRRRPPAPSRRPLGARGPPSPAM